LFGEHFNLTSSDKSRDDVLAKHLHLLGRAAQNRPDPVRREDGSVAIIDLMLSRRLPQAPKANAREHLIVELKRPTVKISLDVHQQLVSYAFAVAEDERFHDTNPRWVFWAVSNEVTREVQKLGAAINKPPGLTYEGEGVEIWVKSWAQILEECRARLHFYQKGLQYEASDESAMSYLRRVHAEYLPPAISATVPRADDEQGASISSVSRPRRLQRQAKNQAHREGPDFDASR